ncbi:MAG: hypothetical protein ACR2QJ_16630 [Geminicoccaceae bacterium]
MQTLTMDMPPAGDEKATITGGYRHQQETRSEPAPWADGGETRSVPHSVDAASDGEPGGGAESDLPMLSLGQGNGHLSDSNDRSWIDSVDLLDGPKAQGDYDADWTSSIDQSGADDRNSGSWLELGDDKAASAAIPEGADIGFQAIDHLSW